MTTNYYVSEDYAKICELAYLRNENTFLKRHVEDLWPHAQKMHTLAHLTEAHTGLADNSAEGIIAAMTAMRATIKSLNRRAQYAEAHAKNLEQHINKTASP
jgi:cell division protein FtsB